MNKTVVNHALSISDMSDKDVVEISGTSDTPTVVLNRLTGKLSFKGRSLPQNPKNFYHPILKWVSAYVLQPQNQTHLVFNLDYFNTASSKMILELIESVKKSEQAGSSLKIEWHYLEDDEEMYDMGREFAELTSCEFNYFTYS